jgi:hypothetical protein
MERKRRSKTPRRRVRRITVRSVRRDPPDIRKLSRAILALAQAEAEREAQAQQQGQDAETTTANPSGPLPGTDEPNGGAPDA